MYLEPGAKNYNKLSDVITDLVNYTIMTNIIRNNTNPIVEYRSFIIMRVLVTYLPIFKKINTIN